MSKLAKLLIAAVVLVAIAAFVVPKVVADLRDDDDLEAKLPTNTPTSTDSAPTGVDPTEFTGTTAPPATDATGTWSAVAGDRDTFFVGYQIEETLRGEDITATGTTGTYTGTLDIKGNSLTALELTVDMTTLESDEGFRDDSIRGEALETNEFPEATFVVDEVVDFGSVTQGEEATAQVTGDLTLHGVTQSIKVNVTARWNGDTIDVTGEIPIVLADYSIVAPSRPFVSVRDEGKVVFVVQFARA